MVRIASGSVPAAPSRQKVAEGIGQDSKADSQSEDAHTPADCIGAGRIALSYELAASNELGNGPDHREHRSVGLATEEIDNDGRHV